MLRNHPQIEGLKVNEDGSEIYYLGKRKIAKAMKTKKNGILRVNLMGTTMTVAKIVCEAWNGIRPDINHTVKRKDGDFNNYHHSNLEWGRNGGNGFIKYKLSQKDIDDIVEAMKVGARNVDLAKQYGVGTTRIKRIKKRAKELGEL